MVRTWTVDNPHRARALASLGVDAIITNEPARIRRALWELLMDELFARSHCGVTFAAPDESGRCPECLRSSGIVRTTSSAGEPEEKGGFMIVLIALVAAGLVVWWWAGEAAPDETAPERVDTPSAVLATVPDELRSSLRRWPGWFS